MAEQAAMFPPRPKLYLADAKMSIALEVLDWLIAKEPDSQTLVDVRAIVAEEAKR